MPQRLMCETDAHAQPRPLPWTPVLDAAGVPVGHVSDPASANGYLLVEKGFFFTKLVYVPFAAITCSDAFGIHLCLRKDELSGAAFSAPIAAAAAIAG